MYLNLLIIDKLYIRVLQNIKQISLFCFLFFNISSQTLYNATPSTWHCDEYTAHHFQSSSYEVLLLITTVHILHEPPPGAVPITGTETSHGGCMGCHGIGTTHLPLLQPRTCQSFNHVPDSSCQLQETGMPKIMQIMTTGIFTWARMRTYRPVSLHMHLCTPTLHVHIGPWPGRYGRLQGIFAHRLCTYI